MSMAARSRHPADDLPVRVSGVRVSSADENKPVLRISPDVLNVFLQPAFAARTRGDMQTALAHAATRLKGTGVFSDVQMVAVPGADVGDVDLRVKLAETDRSFRTGVEFGGSDDGGGVTGGGMGAFSASEARLSTSAALKNQLGLAEVLSGSYQKSNTGTDMGKVSFQKPTLGSHLTALRTSVYADSVNHTTTSSYSALIKGVDVEVDDPSQSHTLSYTAQWRDAVPVRQPKRLFKCAASADVVAQAQASVKSALAYAYNNDTRDFVRPATCGTHIHARTELAGLGGDVQYMRAQANVEGAWSLFWTGGFRGGMGTFAEGYQPGQAGAKKAAGAPDFSWRNPAVTLSLAAQAGWLMPFGADAGAGRPTRLLDRFFAGGVHSMRGYDVCGVGPRAAPVEGGNAQGDALGGDRLLTVNARLVLPPPLPFDTLARVGVRTHLWACAGSLTPRTASPLSRDLLRTAMGWGVVVPLPTAVGMACLEWNHTLRHTCRGTDTKMRFQFGISS